IPKIDFACLVEGHPPGPFCPRGLPPLGLFFGACIIDLPYATWHGRDPSMQVTVQKLSPVLVQLDARVDADCVRRELAKPYATVSGSAPVKGFRPGKAPKKILAHYFGPRVAADVAQRLVDDTFPRAVSEQKVQPVTQPAIEPSPIVENQPFSYKAR